jgi:hypothetical protein
MDQHSIQFTTARAMFLVSRVFTDPLVWLPKADAPFSVRSWTVPVLEPQQFLANLYTTSTYSRRQYLHNSTSVRQNFLLITSHRGLQRKYRSQSSSILRAWLLRCTPSNCSCLQSHYPSNGWSYSCLLCSHCLASDVYVIILYEHIIHMLYICNTSLT